MKSTKLKLILAALSAAVLVACGGGGGGGDGGGSGGNTVLNWGTAEFINTNEAENDSTTGVALGADGTGYAVWVQDDGTGNARVFSRRYVAGVGQEVQEVSETPANSRARLPQVASLANGEAVAVWLEDQSTSTRVVGARTVNRLWQGPVTVAGLAGPDLSGLRLASNGLNDAVAVWEREVAAGKEVVGSGFVNNGFTPEEPVSAAGTNAEAPSVAMASNGRAVIAWHQLDVAGTPTADDDVNRIQAATYIAGNFSGPAVITVTEIEDAETPSVAVGDNGSATIAWEQFDAGVTKVAFSTASDFMVHNWTVPQVLPVAGNSAGVSVARDPQGTSTIVWREFNAGNDRDLKAARVGTNLVPAQTIDALDDVSVTEAVVASDANGGAVVVWLQDVNPSAASLIKPFSNRFNSVTGQWGVAERIDTGLPVADNLSAQSPSVSLAANPAGQALAAWRHTKAAGEAGIAANALK